MIPSFALSGNTGTPAAAQLNWISGLYERPLEQLDLNLAFDPELVLPGDNTVTLLIGIRDNDLKGRGPSLVYWCASMSSRPTS